jgi:hypothetical protein
MTRPALVALPPPEPQAVDRALSILWRRVFGRRS